MRLYRYSELLAIIVGGNLVAVDYVCRKIIGYDHKRVPTFDTRIDYKYYRFPSEKLELTSTSIWNRQPRGRGNT